MASLVLASDTLDTTPSVGAFEYNGKVLTYTPQANTQRGIVPNELFYRLDSGLAGANATGAQNTFGVGVTLAGSTVYEFEILCPLSKSAGTTSHTVSLSFGGTATLNNIAYEAIIKSSTTSFTNVVTSDTVNLFIQTASATAISGAITSATFANAIIIKGTVSVNAGGTFIPQYTLSTAPGGAYTTQAGSYIKLKPIGTSGANTSVGTWS